VFQKRVLRIVSHESMEPVAGFGFLLFAEGGDGEEDAGEGAEKAAVFGGEFEIFDGDLLGAFGVVELDEPFDKEGEAAEDVLAEAGGEVGVAEGFVDGDESFGVGVGGFGVGEGGELSFFDEGGVVGGEAPGEGVGKASRVLGSGRSFFFSAMRSSSRKKSAWRIRRRSSSWKTRAAARVE